MCGETHQGKLSDLQGAGPQQQGSSLSQAAHGIDLAGNLDIHENEVFRDRVEVYPDNKSRGAPQANTQEREATHLDKGKSPLYDMPVMGCESAHIHKAKEKAYVAQSVESGSHFSSRNEGDNNISLPGNQCKGPSEKDFFGVVEKQTSFLQPNSATEGPNISTWEVYRESTYFIQFPDEDQGCTSQLAVPSVTNWEKQLAVNFENILSLKRKREADKVFLIQQSPSIPEGETAEAKRKKVDNIQQLDVCPNAETAEEAGLIMPRLPP